MIGLSPRLPLSLSSAGGYTMLETIVEATKQNLKMLLLTVPGERVMMPNYGVGIKAFLFENDVSTVRSALQSRIARQTKLYMPHIKVTSVSFDAPIGNSMSMVVEYIIVPLQIQNILSLSVENNR
jgi:phage baseplate assembly protein W